MANNLVKHLINVIQALDYSFTPPATQFHNKPISRLTYEEYISQELSIFRKIVTESIDKLNNLNTLRCIMSTGLDYWMAKDILNSINGDKILYESYLQHVEHFTRVSDNLSTNQNSKVVNTEETTNDGDLNQKDEDKLNQEEQLQEVVWAWDQIKDSRNFK